VNDPERLRFSALSALGWLDHGFIGRVPGVDVDASRETVVERLAPRHAAALAETALGGRPLLRAEQVHGATVATVDARTPAIPVPGTDGLLTADPAICLGIYVADCCAVFLADPTHRAVGLIHAGRKGTELGIFPAAIREMQRRFGTHPASLIVQLSPCIRPPHYEVDFAADLRAQAAACGVLAVEDCGLCTGSDVGRWYSYRIERGRTGRMLAVIGVC